MILVNLLLAAMLLQDPFPTYPPPQPGYLGQSFQFTAIVSGGSGTYAYKWEQIYGPAAAALTGADAALVKITVIQPGTYLFRVTVMDSTNSALVGVKDQVLTVSAGYIPASPVSAGLTVTVGTFPPPILTDTAKPQITKVERIVNNSYVDATTGTGAKISGLNNVTLRVTASDNIGVVSAMLVVDNYQVAFVNSAGGVLASQFDIKWSEALIKTGSHTMVLRVWDATGNRSIDKTWIMTK